MPVTLVDRLPLPNLKVYTAGSVLLLSLAVYYADNVTSDPNWRVNLTRQAVDEGDSLEPVTVPSCAGPQCKNLTHHVVEVVTFMMQEPFCMWSVINIAYCILAIFGMSVQRAVFGELRVAEAQRVKDKFWNYVFYKFIFVFGVINVQYMDEVLLWCCWFTVLGALHLFAQLCKDRFQYLSSVAGGDEWAAARVCALAGGVALAGAALLALAAALRAALLTNTDTFAFMAAECILVVVSALHVAARYWLQVYEADVAGPLTYYTHLLFDSVCLVVELVHVVHMVVYSNMLVSMASLVLLMQLRHVLHELQARLARHRLYTERATQLTRNCPMASKEEVEKNQDNCAICWEPMKEARKLPCAHLFHNSCLCQWVQQDASCPTCRRELKQNTPTHDTLFHFDGDALMRSSWVCAVLLVLITTATLFILIKLKRTQWSPARTQGSRYVSWLPSFSVEVTRVRSHSTDSTHAAPMSPPPEPVPSAAPALTPAPAPSLHSLHKEESVRFAASVSEREASLQQRKLALVAAARARYLARHAPQD